jgi:hypothetical protein
MNHFFVNLFLITYWNTRIKFYLKNTASERNFVLFKERLQRTFFDWRIFSAGLFSAGVQTSAGLFSAELKRGVYYVSIM